MKHTILFLAANPSGTDPRALDREARAIHVELERSGFRDSFELVTRWAAEPFDLLRELRKLKPTVLHFSGHGGQDGLFFQGSDGRPQLVSTEALEETFSAAGTSVKLVVLSACYSEGQAKALLPHVGCVVGMSGSRHDDAARSFAIGFYGGLGERESVAAAYKQGCAAIRLAGIYDSEVPRIAIRTDVVVSALVLAVDPRGPSVAPPSTPRPAGRIDFTAERQRHHRFVGQSAAAPPAQTRTRQPIDPASALISNTMVCEASRLVTPVDEPHPSWTRDTPLDIRAIRILDLFSLIEAVVLHDKIYTLPARQSHDTSGLQLRTSLIDTGVICELNTASKHDEIVRVLIEALISVPDSSEKAGESRPKTDRLRKEISGFLLLESEAKRKMRPRLRGPTLRLDDNVDYGLTGLGGNCAANISLETFDSFGGHLIHWLESHLSGAYEACTSILRDAYYIFAAEHFGLPYWPHFSRIELSRTFPNFFNTAARLELYGRVAEAFKASVEEVFEDSDEQVVHIPPFATLVLDRCNSAADLVPELLAIREEFASLRVGFARLEEERRSALTLKERIRARQHQKQLLDDLGRRFESPTQIKLEGVVRYVPDPEEPGARPANPSRYTARLAAMPLESVARWWRRRPISKLFELKGRLERVRSYEHLVRKVFGADINLGWIPE